MYDNARPHREGGRNWVLRGWGYTIERMVWHANSADLNPIEHLRDQLRCSVYRRIAEYSNWLGSIVAGGMDGYAGEHTRQNHEADDALRLSRSVVHGNHGYIHY